MTTTHRYDTPPSLSPESGTPADEWAKETEGAIEQHALSKGATEDSTVVTQAQELPGAFPIAQTRTWLFLSSSLVYVNMVVQRKYYRLQQNWGRLRDIALRAHT
jgi:hypothetical protein